MSIQCLLTIPSLLLEMSYRLLYDKTKQINGKLKYIPALLVIAILFSNSAYADTPGQLGIKLLPGKISENSNGFIQVYSKSVDSTVDKLIATSSDPSIIQILGVEKVNSTAITNVKVKAIRAGQAKVALAAPGFSSEEFTIDVSKSSNIASKLFVKATPTSFNLDGPTHGYVAVETTNENDIPTAVSSDTPITLSTSDKNLVSLKESQVVIKKGTYYAVGEFDVIQAGSPQISASSSLMQTVSTPITITNENLQNTLQAYVYPQTINAYTGANAYVVVQLHDDSDNPVLATEDIQVKVNISNSTSSDAINTSSENPLFQSNQLLTIPKGSYWGYIPIEISAGTNGVFNVDISARGNLISTAAQLTCVTTNAVLDDKSARMDALPILATGNRELVGIMHLQDSAGNTLLAKDNLNIHVDSSDPSTVLVSDVQMSRGSQAAPVFAQIGNVVNPVTLNVVTPSPQTIATVITSPNTESSLLVAEPLIQKILTNSKFPLAAYVKNNNILASFNSNFNMLVAPANVIQAGTMTVTKDNPIAIADSTLLKDGLQQISITGSTYSATSDIEGFSSNPKSIAMDYSDSIVANTPNQFSLELLDGQSLPVYATNNIAIKLVSSDPSVIEIPGTVQITKGNYYNTFSVMPMTSGTAEISVLADQIPLSKFTVSVTSFKPEVSIQSSDFSESNNPITATMTAMYKQTPLTGLQVKWKADGATIQNMDLTTNSEGQAKITLLSPNPGTLHIEATVSGGSYDSTVVTKDVTVNAPLASQAQTQQTQNNSQPSFTIMGINPILFIIPVVAGLGVLLFKKREILSTVTEKIGFGGKIGEIKEKMTALTQR